MPTYLRVYKGRTDSPQNIFLEQYELRNVDYELYRELNSKGDFNSDLKGGTIRVAIDGFGNEALFQWIFKSGIESGEIVCTDIYEQVIEKTYFTKAKAKGYKLRFDTSLKHGLVSIFTIQAAEISTDRELFFESKD